jgi:thioredoxin-related protein
LLGKPVVTRSQEHAMGNDGYFGSYLGLASLVFLIVFAELLSTPARANDDPPAQVDDRFANEPKRPKAESRIQFSKAWNEASAESKRTGRRLMAYFTSDNCGWCRVLEKRTFTDAEVVELSKQFVCVEVNISEDRNSRLADKYRIDSIPRTIIFTPDDEVIEQRTGYVPAAEYAAWLKGVGNTPTATVETRSSPTAPAPVGFAEADSDVVIWFVDATESLNRWNDGDWTGHAHLRRLLGSAGLRPRIEHISRDEFAERWDRAKTTGQAPDLITADKWAGLVRDLETKGLLIHLQSERLSWMTEVASCGDFARRWRFLVADSAQKSSARKAVDELHRPGPETSLPGPVLPGSEGRDEAVAIARRAAVAFVSGDPSGMKEVASVSSPQLSRCTAPEDFRSGWAADAGAVEVRGNASVAFARVEIRYRGKNVIGADAFLVILRKEPAGWRAFAVTNDVICMKELAALCRFSLRSGPTGPPPPTPRLSSPVDGGTIGGKEYKSFGWEIPGEHQPLAAQVCQVLLNSQQGRSWPDIRFKIYPGEPRTRSLSAYDESLTGVRSQQMFWCVWRVGLDGQISVSEVRKYQFAPFKY